MIRTLLSATITVFAGCAAALAAEPAKPANPPTKFPVPAEVNSARAAGPFDERLQKIASEYVRWGRVDEKTHWAPVLCEPAISAPPAYTAQVRLSQSEDQGTHGSKLYSLFARYRDEYLSHGDLRGRISTGQAIVKQSWHAEEVTDAKQRPGKQIDQSKMLHQVITTDPKSKVPVVVDDHFYPYAWRGEKVYKATTQADLFVMLKLDPKTADTDQGWVYATLTPDGKQVTGAGKLESCMKCHLEAKHERLFGLKTEQP